MSPHPTTAASTPSHPVPDLAAWLCGTWRLERTVVDPTGAPLATFTGRLTVVRDGPDTLRSVERGDLVHEGVARPASRALRYDLHDGGATVRFDDGRTFHELDLRTGRAEVVHPCGDDTYRGSVQVISEDRWQQRWEVTGPAKSYVSTTVATRSTGPGHGGPRAGDGVNAATGANGEPRPPR